MRKVLIIAVFTLFVLPGISQEFKCNLQISSQQIQGTDKRVFETLQTELQNFINERQWTNFDFKTNERIDCSMVINITGRDGDNFEAQLTVVASRPVFNSSYSTTLLNYLDKDFTFDYMEYQPLEFEETSHMSNLTSVVVYYLYMILGLDFDSFTEMGGTPFFEKAEQIVNNASSDPSPGWRAYEGTRNRYWLVENYINSTYEDLRKFSYQYHLKGLDRMWEKQDEGRNAVLQSLQLLQNVKDARPGLFGLQLVLESKREEVIDIFSEGSSSQKSQAEEIMKGLDPSHTSDYNAISR